MQMSSIKIAGSRHGLRQAPQDRPRPSAAWLLFAGALVGLAALLGFVAEPRPAGEGLAPPQAQHILEDWRGNSASIEPSPE
jgi:hypothetical protein